MYFWSAAPRLLLQLTSPSMLMGRWDILKTFFTDVVSGHKNTHRANSPQQVLINQWITSFTNSNEWDTHSVFHRWLMCCLPLQMDLTLCATSCLYMKPWEMGRTTALVRAVNWGKLGYVLIGHMVVWDEKEKTVSYILDNLLQQLLFTLCSLLLKNKTPVCFSHWDVG